MDSRLTKILIVAIIIIFAMGAVFFRKDNDRRKNTTDMTAQKQEQEQIDEIKKNGSAKTLENFLMIYNDYTYGDFSNITNLFPYMTTEFKQIQGRKIEKLEEISKDKKYETVKPKMTDVEMISYDSQFGKLVMKITIEKSIYGGQEISNPNYDGTTGKANIIVNRQGAEYNDSFENLLEKKEVTIYLITGIKESEGWKVSDLQEVK